MNRSETTILEMTFSLDNSRFACGTDDGFMVYAIDPLGDTPLIAREFGGGISCVEVLEDTNIVALVGGGNSPQYDYNKVIIYDDNRDCNVVEIQLKNRVLNVKLTRDRIVVCTSERVLVYDFQSLELVIERRTYKNSNGIVAVGTLDGQPVLVCLGETLGCINIYIGFNDPVIINAHDNDIQCITLSSDNTKLATASSKGTLIRIWDVRSGVEIKCVRRGASHTDVHSLSFSKDDQYLSLTSSSQTLHIFSTIPEETSYWNLSSKILYEKSLCSMRIPETYSIATFGNQPNTIRAFGATGTYYKFSFSPNQGTGREEGIDRFLMDSF
eukprot:TRINITY_DN7579_c0_g1_i1.p1 TRINITY_DN7579_c0_g1~~TRINITY_DN7579_c0_g1_i1.p1  ORF type:complete len:327 (+),score=47.83 TRINITY_DN7579_c0_g1_i1:289-1269(+)